MKSPNKRLQSILIIDFIILIVCILGSYQNIQKAGLEPGKHLTFEIKENAIYVNKIIQPDLGNIFVKGDKIVSIENKTVSRKEDIELILDSFSVGDSVSFSIMRNAQSINFKLRLQPYYSLFENSIQAFVGLMFFVLGVFVIYKRFGLLMANVWHWASVGAAIIITTTWGKYSTTFLDAGQLTRLFFFFAYAFVPTLFVQLSFVFPRYKWKNLKKLIYPLYSFSALLAVYMSFTFLMTIHSDSLDWFHKFLMTFDLNRAYFAVAMSFGVINIFHSSINVHEESERRQIRWVFFGLAIGPPSFVFLWQIPQLLSYDALISESTLVLTMLVVPVTFSIAIVKYHVFNIDHIFRRSTVYLFLALIMLVIYASLVGLSVLFIGLNFESSLVTTVIAAILTPLFFEPLRRALQKIVDKKFFRVHYNYRLAQQHFTEELNKSLDLNSIVQMAIWRVDDLLQLTYSAIYVKSDTTTEWSLVASKHFDQVSKELIKELYICAQSIDHSVLTNQGNVEAGLEIENIKLPGEENELGFLAIPLKTAKNEIIGMLILGKKKSGQKYTLEDIDLLKTVAIQLGLAIQRAGLQKQLVVKNLEAEKLNELNQLKSYFVASVSHDLQSPLTSIKMFAEILNKKRNLPEQKRTEYLKIIEGESSRLSRLINNVLNFSKIERGQKEYHLKKTSINMLLHNVVKMMDYQLQQQKFTVTENYSDEDIIMDIDEDAFISVAINLVSNAIKYSGKQKSLTISTQSKKDRVVIEFKDKGFGISDADKQHIFETFYRSQDESIRSSGGAGLGLTLVDHVLKAHNGHVEVTSTLGEGSTFTLTLPFKKG